MPLIAESKPVDPSILEPSGAPAYWAYLDQPGKTYPADTGDVRDLAGNSPAAVRGSAALWCDTPYGRGLIFDGTSNAVVTLGSPAALIGWTACTVFARYRVGTTAQAANARIAEQGANTSWALVFNSAGTRIAGQLGSTSAITGPVVNDGAWHSVALTITPSSSSWVGALLHDGAQVGTGTNAAGTGASSSSLIGQYGGGGINLNGQVAEFRFYRRVLTGDEIRREHEDPWWRLRAVPPYFALSAGGAGPAFSAAWARQPSNIGIY